jgi:hypothetical protein
MRAASHVTFSAGQLQLQLVSGVIYNDTAVTVWPLAPTKRVGTAFGGAAQEEDF